MNPEPESPPTLVEGWGYLINVYQKLDMLVSLKVDEKFGHEPMCNWIALDEEWQQRTKRLVQRCLNEPDMTKSQLMLDRAYKSESRRLEWQDWYTQHQETLDNRYNTSTYSLN
jgi:hypothetical protein